MLKILTNNFLHAFCVFTLAVSPLVSSADRSLGIQDKYDTAEWINNQHLFYTVPLFGYTNVEAWAGHFASLENSVHQPAKNGTMTNTLFKHTVLNKAYPNEIYGAEGDICKSDFFLEATDPPQSVWYDGKKPRFESVCRCVNGIDTEKKYLIPDKVELDKALGLPLTGFSWYASSESFDNYPPLPTVSTWISRVWPNCVGLLPSAEAYRHKVVDKYTYTGESDEILKDPSATAMFRSVEMSAPYDPLPLYGYFPSEANGIDELSQCHHIVRYLSMSPIDIRQEIKHYTIKQRITWTLTYGPISGEMFSVIEDVSVSEPEVEIFPENDTYPVQYFSQKEFTSSAHCRPVSTVREYTGDVYYYIVVDGLPREMALDEGSVSDRENYLVQDAHYWATGNNSVPEEAFDRAWSRSTTWEETILYTTKKEYPVITTDSHRLNWDFDRFPPNPFPNIMDSGFMISDARAVCLSNTSVSDDSPDRYSYGYYASSYPPTEEQKIQVITNWNMNTAGFLRDSCGTAVTANQELIDVHKLGPDIYDTIPQYYSSSSTGDAYVVHTHIILNRGYTIAGVCDNLKTGGNNIKVDTYRQYHTEDGEVTPQIDGIGSDIHEIYGYVCDTNECVMPGGEWEFKSWINVSPFFSYKVETPKFIKGRGKVPR